MKVRQGDYCSGLRCFHGRNDIEHNDIRRNDTQLNNKNTANLTTHIHYAECDHKARYAESRCAERHYAQHPDAESYYAERHYAGMSLC